MSYEDARMTFTEHLGELRVRIIRSGTAVIIGMVVCYIFSNTIFYLVAKPLMSVTQKTTVSQTGTPVTTPAPPAPSWIAMSPLEGVWVKMRLAGYGGLVLAFPYIMMQICGFIFPGLTPRERKAATILFVGGGCFAVLGVCVAYFFLLPMVLPYLSAYLPEGVEQKFAMSQTINIILMALAGFAVAFQFPMIAWTLVYLGVLTPATLKHYRRVAIIGQACLAALLTPPDPISMLILLIPLTVLYEISIWVSYLIVRRKEEPIAPEPVG